MNTETRQTSQAKRITELEKQVAQLQWCLAEQAHNLTQLIVQLKMAMLQQAMQNPDAQKVIMDKMAEEMRRQGAVSLQ